MTKGKFAAWRAPRGPPEDSESEEGPLGQRGNREGQRQGTREETQPDDGATAKEGEEDEEEIMEEGNGGAGKKPKKRFDRLTATCRRIRGGEERTLRVWGRRGAGVRRAGGRRLYKRQ